MVILWYLWFTLSRKISRRRYDPKNDRGLKGEENRQKLIAEGKPDPTKSIIDDAGFKEPPRPSLLPTTEANDTGKADTSTGKTSKSNGGLSKRFRRNPFRRKQ